MQSKLLTKFYKELHAWIQDGCPNDGCFHKTFGICFNLTQWLHKMNWASKAAFDEEHTRAQKELIDQFKKAGLNERFPFNPRGPQGYSDEWENRWNNEGRKHWVFAHSRTVN